MNLTLPFINDVHGYLEPHAELFYEGRQEIIRQADVIKGKEINTTYRNFIGRLFLGLN